MENATKCTLTALQRRYVALGAIEVPSICVVDDQCVCTVADFHTLLELRKLGVELWLLGDASSQLLAMGNAVLGADLTGDISDTAMLRGAVVCQRCVFTKPKRCDERLFAWLSTVAAAGWRWQLIQGAIAQARAAFPKRGHPAQTSLCLCHLTRKRIIHRAQKAALRRERPAHWIAVDGDAPLGQRTPGPARAI